MSHIFISYSRTDLANGDNIVKSLIARLRRNFRIWLDKSDITPGTNWKHALQQAVSSSGAMVVILSPNSANSEWVETEIGVAQSKKIPIIPYVYQPVELPFGLGSTNAIFHYSDERPQQKLEEALKELVPEMYIHGDGLLASYHLIGNKDLSFTDAAQKIGNALRFIVTLKDTEIDLIGLPLKATTFCTTYLIGRSADKLDWQARVQLALQFSGKYGDADFPVRIAKHFLSENEDFKLRMVLVRGPGKITYDEKHESNAVSHELDVPTADEQNQWIDALNAIQQALLLYHKGREAPKLQVFVQGPVAGITYELGAEHRNLHYQAEHYQYDREKQTYYRVLGKLD